MRISSNVAFAVFLSASAFVVGTMIYVSTLIAEPPSIAYIKH